MVSPVYPAFDPDLLTAVTAELPELHSAIEPSAVAKINLLAAKSAVLLKTTPVGEPGFPGVTEGTVTGGRNVLPVVSYMVLSPVLAAEIHTGPPAFGTAMPQALSRLASTLAAPSLPASTTRFVCLNGKLTIGGGDV